MADDFKKKEGSSLAQTLLAGVPLGLGIRSYLKKTNFSQAFNPPVNPIQSTLDPITQTLGSIRSGTNEVANRWGKRSLRGLEELVREGSEGATTLSGTAVQDALIYAAEHADASGSALKMINRRFGNVATKTGRQVVQEVIEVFQTAPTVHLRRVAALFLDNLNMLEQRSRLGLSLTMRAVHDDTIASGRAITSRQLAASNPLLADHLLAIKRELKGTMTVKKFARSDIEGGLLQVNIKGSPYLAKGMGKKAQMTFEIPLTLETQPNMVRAGYTQQSLHIAGQFAEIKEIGQGRTVIKGLQRYDQWAASQAMDHLVMPLMEQVRAGKKVTRRMTQAQVAAYGKHIRRYRDQLVDMPLGASKARDLYASTRGQVLRLFHEGAPISNEIMQDILKQGGVYDPSGAFTALFPGHSATQMTHGALSLKDWAQEVSLSGNAWAQEKAPLQGLRWQWDLAPGEEERIRGLERFQRSAWAQPGARLPTKPVRTLYVPEKTASKHLYPHGFNPEGGAWISEIALPKMTENISPIKLAELTPEFEQIIGPKRDLYQINKIIPAGTHLGRDLNGNPIVLQQDTRLLEAIRHKDRDNAAYLAISGTKNIEYGDWAATWDTKHMAARKDRGTMIGRLKEMGLWNRETIKDPIHSFVPLGDLLKNQALHHQQMYTSIWDCVTENLQRAQRQVDRPFKGKALAMAQDPRAYIAALEARATSKVGGKTYYDANVILKDLLQVARGGDLKGSQMGEVFGGVPKALGLDTSTSLGLQMGWTKKMMELFPDPSMTGIDERDLQAYFNIGRGNLTPTQKQWIATYGLTRKAAKEVAKEAPVNPFAFFQYAGPGGPGAGNRGSIEPRMLELFKSPHWGELGPQVQQEIAERMGARYPNRLIEQETLGQALESLIQPGKAGGTTFSPSELSLMAKERRAELMGEGFNLRVKGFGDVMIPSGNTLKQLADYKTASGEVIHSDLAHQYRSFIEQAGLFESKEINKDIFMDSVHGLQEQVARSKALTFSGVDSLGRGELPGSRYLTMVPHEQVAKTPWLEASGEVFATDTYMNKMFGDMEDLYGQEYTKGLRGKWEAGEGIEGIMGRHPGIGPYSIAPVQFKRMAGDGANIAIPEYFMNAKWKNPASGKWEELASQLRFSPAVGMAGDYDKDIAFAMIAGPNTKEGIRRTLTNPEWIQNNLEHQIRSQLLKSKVGPATGLSLEELRAAGASKLRVPKESLGLLSEELGTTKAAVLAHMDPAGGRVGAAQSFLEWWEQTPISGKHIQPGRESELRSLFEQGTRALREGNAPLFKQATEKIFSQKALQGLQGAMLYGNVEMEIGGDRTMIKGHDLGGLLDDIMNARKKYQAAPPGGLSEEVMRGIQRGKPSRAARSWQIPKMAATKMKTAFGAYLPASMGGKGAMTALGETVNAARNKMGAIGRGLLEHARPLGLGFAAAVGLSTVLSRPGQTLDTSDLTPPAPRMQSGTGGAQIPTGIHPEGYVSGEPTVRNPVEGSNTAMVSPGQPPGATRVVVRGASRGADYQAVSQSLSGATRGGQISSRVRDDRVALTPQKLASILYRG